MISITIVGGAIHTLDDFYDQIVKSLNVSYFGRNLDALYGSLIEEGIEEIIFEDSAIIREKLGKLYTIEYYKQKLSESKSPYEKEFLEKSLHELEKGRGVTLFERVISVLEEIDTLNIVYL